MPSSFLANSAFSMKDKFARAVVLLPLRDDVRDLLNIFDHGANRNAEFSSDPRTPMPEHDHISTIDMGMRPDKNRR